MSTPLCAGGHHDQVGDVDWRQCTISNGGGLAMIADDILYSTSLMLYGYGVKVLSGKILLLKLFISNTLTLALGVSKANSKFCLLPMRVMIYYTIWTPPLNLVK